MLLCELDILARNHELPRFMKMFTPYNKLIYYILFIISMFLSGVPSHSSTYNPTIFFPASWIFASQKLLHVDCQIARNLEETGVLTCFHRRVQSTAGNTRMAPPRLPNSPSNLGLQMVLPLLGRYLPRFLNPADRMAKSFLRIPLQSIPRPRLLRPIPMPRPHLVDPRRQTIRRNRLVQRNARNQHALPHQCFPVIKIRTAGVGTELFGSAYYSLAVYALDGGGCDEIGGWAGCEVFGVVV